MQIFSLLRTICAVFAFKLYLRKDAQQEILRRNPASRYEKKIITEILTARLPRSAEINCAACGWLRESRAEVNLD